MKALQHLISEARRHLFESEVWVDDEGYAHDDEGNKWYVGKQKAGYIGKGGSLSGGGYRAKKPPKPYPWTGTSTPDLTSQEVRDWQRATLIGSWDDLARHNMGPGSKEWDFMQGIYAKLNKYDGSDLTDAERKQAYAILKKVRTREPHRIEVLFGPPGRPRSPAPDSVASSGEQIEVLRKALRKKTDTFLSSVLSSLENERHWWAGAAEDTKKKIRHELYKRGLRKEADLFR